MDENLFTKRATQLALRVIIALKVASIKTLQKRDRGSLVNRQSKIENLK